MGDIDQDGDLDVVGTRGDTGEVEWYANPGGVLTSSPAKGPRIASTWRTSITTAVDLDQDGDLDLVSIAWDEPKPIYVWRNDAVRVALPAL